MCHASLFFTSRNVETPFPIQNAKIAHVKISHYTLSQRDPWEWML